MNINDTLSKSLNYNKELAISYKESILPQEVLTQERLKGFLEFYNKNEDFLISEIEDDQRSYTLYYIPIRFREGEKTDDQEKDNYGKLKFDFGHLGKLGYTITSFPMNKSITQFSTEYIEFSENDAENYGLTKILCEFIDKMTDIEIGNQD